MDLSYHIPGVNFTAVDFETANGQLNSICQVGLVRVENGQIVKELDILVQPPNNAYHWGNTKVHGLRSVDTAQAPAFKDVWEHMKPYIVNQLFVAHNVQFDAGCLRATLAYYNLPVPIFNTQCTVKIYKRNLKFLADQYGIPLNHHNALSDARACAYLYLKHLQEQQKRTSDLALNN